MIFFELFTSSTRLQRANIVFLSHVIIEFNCIWKRKGTILRLSQPIEILISERNAGLQAEVMRLSVWLRASSAIDVDLIVKLCWICRFRCGIVIATFSGYRKVYRNDKKQRRFRLISNYWRIHYHERKVEFIPKLTEVNYMFESRVKKNYFRTMVSNSKANLDRTNKI